MKWYDYNFWKAVVGITLAMYVSLLIIGCGSSKTVTKQTYLKDELNERNFDSLFTTRMSYSFEQWLHFQKREIERELGNSGREADDQEAALPGDGARVHRCAFPRTACRR